MVPNRFEFANGSTIVCSFGNISIYLHISSLIGFILNVLLLGIDQTLFIIILHPYGSDSSQFFSFLNFAGGGILANIRGGLCNKWR